ncbi:MAG: phosphoribosyltransferase [Deltaproteobacteria bacterium]|nr:phosphoribosyltransferase [Deltaproteobacteria bacterium]
MDGSEKDAGLKRVGVTGRRLMRIQGEPPYRNRTDAGRALAQSLEREAGNDAVVFGIPRGGIPVSAEVAKDLGLKLDIVVPRKIPIPGNTEAGYGAVTEDGIIVLNDILVAQLGLSEREIQSHAQEVTEEIGRRLSLYRTKIGPSSVEGRKAIIIDDGLASGYTMLAAIESLRKRGAVRVIAASPVASSHARELLKFHADGMIVPIVSSAYPFAVAEFYEHWHDLTDDEVLEELERYGKSLGKKADAARGSVLGKTG